MQEIKLILSNNCLQYFKNMSEFMCLLFVSEYFKRIRNSNYLHFLQIIIPKLSRTFHRKKPFCMNCIKKILTEFVFQKKLWGTIIVWKKMLKVNKFLNSYFRDISKLLQSFENGNDEDNLSNPKRSSRLFV